jgi:hypothetical protein
MIITIIVMFLLLATCIYIINNLYNKVEYLTTYAGNIVQSLELIRTRVLEMNSHIRAIDKRGTFQSDDEVGYFFKELQNITDRLNILFSVTSEKTIQLKDDSYDNDLDYNRSQINE